VQQWDYLDQDSEKWYITYLGNGIFTITNKLQPGRLYVGGLSDGDSIVDSDNFHLADLLLGDTRSSFWQLIQQPDGSYLIQSLLSGGFLSVRGNALLNGLPIQQWYNSGSEDQRWEIEPVSSTSTNGAGGSNGSQGSGSPPDPGVGSIPALPDPPSPLNDISGTWTDNSNLSGTWTLTQIGNTISGTLTSRYQSCPVVTWAVTGEAANGTFNLTAQNPSPGFDPCSGRIAAVLVSSTITSLTTAGIGTEQTTEWFPLWTGLPSPSGIFSFVLKSRSQSLANLKNLASLLQQSVSTGNKNSCQALADFAQSAANQDGATKDAFVSDFQILTPNQTAVKLIPGVYGRPEGQWVPLGDYRSPTGFATQFVDSQLPNSDQGHHFAAYFQLGYVWTALAAKFSARSMSLWKPLDQAHRPVIQVMSILRMRPQALGGDFALGHSPPPI